MSYRTALAALALLGAACRTAKEPAMVVETAPVEQRDIVVEAEATGAVEPVDTVAVKSIAGGLVTSMPVEVGSVVKPGDLLVQIDTRDLRNQYEQERANLAAAQARLSVAQAARQRAEQLAAQRIITAAERETATADYAAAQSAVVTARTNLDIARQRLDNARVTAQVGGTVISKPISVGTVIASATSSVGGGTTLLTIADLSRVRMRALVNETDIGNVKVGQAATVTVDAFPDRRFTGTVEKIEPQAVVQQSVTMFPVLVSLQNPDRVLLPGMNGEVTMTVQERQNVIAVPNDAVRSTRELAAAAQALGLSSDSVRALTQAQFASRRGGAGTGGAAGGGPGADVGGTVQVTDSACAVVTGALTRTPGVQGALDSLRQRMRSGEIGMQEMRTQAQALYARAGVDPRTAMACQRRAGGGGAGGGARQQSAMRGGAAARGGGVPGNGAGAAGQGGSAGGAGGAGGAARGGAGRAALSRGVVFVKDGAGWSPRFVQIGVSNYDYTEVRGDLRPGEQVALLGAALLQQTRQQQNERIRSMTGGPLGGGGGGAGGAGRAGAAGGGGGQRGGGGPPPGR